MTVWSPREDQDTGWLRKECDAFNAAHPNWDVTFEYGVCAEGDAKATVTTDVEGSADVYMLANDNIPDLVAANALAGLGGSYL
ncbi:MAG: extracellular solute-binding protein, partial [Roseburia inulinivorans]